MACFCVLMAQNRYIFLPPNSLDLPTLDTSIPNTAKSTSILNCKNVGVTWRVSDCEELVGLVTGDDTDIKLSKREVLLSGECNSTQIV